MILDGVVYPSADEAAGYLARGAWIDGTAGDALRQAAARRPEQTALVAGGDRIDYRRYDEDSERLAAALLGLGLEPGDRAVFQMGTGIDTAVCLFACFKAGIIPVCTLPQHRELEIGHLARVTGALCHFVEPAAGGQFDLVAFARGIGLRHLVTSDDFPTMIASIPLDDARARLKHIALGPADVMMFQLSGGTTGVPKVIPRLHGEYLGYCAAWSRLMRLGPDDVGLWALPLIHNAAMIYHLIPAVLDARKLVLMAKFDAAGFFDLIEREGVTASGSIGPVAARILEYAGIGDHDLSSLKSLTTLSRADAIEAHVGVVTTNAFGISAGLLMACPPDAPAAARHGSAGIPASPLDEIRLLDPASEADVPFGQIGEMAFRGPSLMKGYYGGSPARHTADGFFRTGDLMRAMMVDGVVYYAFEGRIKDNIDRGGEKFGPEEVESLIVRHPAIADAKVVAMPDPVYGEKACAFLIPRAGRHLPGVAELGSFLLAQGIAKFKLPERIEEIESFPVTRVGKVDRQALRQIIANLMSDKPSARRAG